MPSNRAAILTPSAHQVAVALLDHIAQMDADAELDTPLGRKPSVALDHAVLHLYGAAYGVDHAAKLDERAVAGALHNAPVMRGDGGIDQIAPQPPQPRQGAILVGAGKPAVSDHVRRQYRSEFPGLGHGVPPGTTLDYHKDPFRTGQNRKLRATENVSLWPISAAPTVHLRVGYRRSSSRAERVLGDATALNSQIVGECRNDRRRRTRFRRGSGCRAWVRMVAFLADTYSPSTRRVCSIRISSAMLVRDKRTSSANGAFGRQKRHDSDGIRLVTAASW